MPPNPTVTSATGACTALRPTAISVMRSSGSRSPRLRRRSGSRSACDGPEKSLNKPAPGRGHGRRQFLLLASLFFVPLAAAIWLYFSSGWRPGGGAEHGTLIDPPRPLPDAPLALADGSAAPADALKSGWSLIFVEDETC